MRLLIAIILLCCISISATSQSNPFPNRHESGNSVELEVRRGAMTAAVGQIGTRYPDTLTANLNPYLKTYPGAWIVVKDTIFLRDYTAQYWINMFPIGSGGGIVSVTARNDLINIDDSTIELGGGLLHNTTLDHAQYYLQMTGTNDGFVEGVLNIHNTSTNEDIGTALYSRSDFGTAVKGYGLTNGVYGYGEGAGVFGESFDGVALSGLGYGGTTASTELLKLRKEVVGIQNGGGANINFELGTPTTTNATASIAAILTNNATSGSSRLDFSTNLAGVSARKFSIGDNGQLRADIYGDGAFTGTPTYCLGTDGNGNIIEVDCATGAIVQGLNGLHNENDSTIYLGGVLLEATTISSDTASINLNIQGVNTAANNAMLEVSTTGFGGTAIRGTSLSGTAIHGVSTNSPAVLGNSTGGNAVSGTATTGTGVVGVSNSGVGGNFSSTSNVGVQGVSNATYGVSSHSAGTSNTVLPNLRIRSIPSTVPALNGFGGSIDFETNTTNYPTLRQTNRIISKWTDATDASRTSELIITGVVNATQQDIFKLDGNGQARLHKYGVGTFDDTHTRILGVTSNGTVIEVDGGGIGGGVDSVTSDVYKCTDTLKYWIGGTATVFDILRKKSTDLLAGGFVVEVDSVTVTVSEANYQIDCDNYSAPDTSLEVNLTASDLRIDVIAANTSGQMILIEGTESANPFPPTVPSNQIAISFVLVGAAGIQSITPRTDNPTLQESFDEDPTASPQINARGNDFIIDSVANLYFTALDFAAQGRDVISLTNTNVGANTVDDITLTSDDSVGIRLFSADLGLGNNPGNKIVILRDSADGGFAYQNHTTEANRYIFPSVTGTNGQILKMGANDRLYWAADEGDSSQWTTQSSTKIYYLDSVGIGRDSARATLDVKGDLIFEGQAPYNSVICRFINTESKKYCGF